MFLTSITILKYFFSLTLSVSVQNANNKIPGVSLDVVVLVVAVVDTSGYIIETKIDVKY